jgi:hypothetical protein
MISSITLDDYESSQHGKEPIVEQIALAFHHFFLTNCVVKITSTNEYMVRVAHKGQKIGLQEGKISLRRHGRKIAVT